MFEYLRNVEGNSNPVMLSVKATSTAANQPVQGDAVAISAGLAVKAGAASTAILGIAKEGVDINGDVLVIVDPQATYRVDYAGTLSQAKIFTNIDLTNEIKVNGAASSTEVFTLLSYDATTTKAVVKINKPIL